MKNPYQGAMITSAAMSGMSPAKYTSMSRRRSRQARCRTVHHSIHAAVATESAVRTHSGARSSDLAQQEGDGEADRQQDERQRAEHAGFPVLPLLEPQSLHARRHSQRKSLVATSAATTA